ncbi:hypothetical protein ACJK9F_001621 [Lelliottia nimipressuralis]|uniref:hypothetical protein n=1 Tax=Lelliottia nimipressuralis TaxID=69220 RepID=UPI003905A044
MQLSGYAFVMSDNSEIYIAPKDGVDSCMATHDHLEITIDVLKGSFKAKILDKAAQTLGVLEFKKALFEVPEGGTRDKDDPGNVGILWCRATNCCCNCGAGWICG